MAQAREAGNSRSAAQARPPLVLAGLTLLSMLGCVAAAAWIYLNVPPAITAAEGAARAEIARVQGVTDQLASSEIAVGIAGGDYGEVQETLARHEAAGYVTRAVVVNAAGKSVAAVGGVEGLRVGDPVSGELRGAARTIAIAIGAQNLGQLLILVTPAPLAVPASKVIRDLPVAAMLVAALALMSAGSVVWLWREARTRVEGMRRHAAAAEARAKTAGLSDQYPAMMDMGPSTLQDMESELRKRVADLRERRGHAVGGPNSDERG